MADTIRAQTIAALIRNVLDPSGNHTIHWDADISVYITGGAPALSAFAAVLNSSQQFVGYAIDLAPHHMAKVKKVSDLIEVVIGAFKRNGWTVAI